MTVDLPFARHAVKDLVAHRRKVYCLDWSCNGKKLATGSNDQTVRVWSVDAKHKVHLLLQLPPMSRLLLACGAHKACMDSAASFKSILQSL